MHKNQFPFLMDWFIFHLFTVILDWENSFLAARILFILSRFKFVIEHFVHSGDIVYMLSQTFILKMIENRKRKCVWNMKFKTIECKYLATHWHTHTRKYNETNRERERVNSVSLDQFKKKKNNCFLLTILWVLG